MLHIENVGRRGFLKGMLGAGAFVLSVRWVPAEMFGSEASSLKAESRTFNFRYRSPDHFLDVFKTFYGPVLKAFAALDPAKQEEFRDDLHALIVRMNRADDGTMVVPSEYLEVVITRR